MSAPAVAVGAQATASLQQGISAQTGGATSALPGVIATASDKKENAKIASSATEGASRFANERTPLKALLPADNQYVAQSYGTGNDEHREIALEALNVATFTGKNGRRICTENKLYYRIHCYKTHSDPFRHLGVFPSIHAVGAVSRELYEQEMRAASPDGPTRGVRGVLGSIPWDFTAVCYVAGFIVSRTLFGYSTTLGTDVPQVLSVYSSPDQLSEATIIVSNATGCDANQRHTFMQILYALGVRSVMTTSKSMTASVHTLAEGSLASYCLWLTCKILACANVLQCAGQHLVAWFRGVNAAVSICATTDEGGWLRGMLRTVDLATPCGLLFSSVSPYFGCPNLIPSVDMCWKSRAVELIFYSVRCITAADPGRNTLLNGKRCQVVLERCVEADDAEFRPSEFSALEDATNIWITNFCRVLCEGVGFVPPDTSIEHTTQKYFSQNRVDAHFKTDYLIPFYLVEPGPFDVFANVKDPFQRIGSATEPAFVKFGSAGFICAVRGDGWVDDEDGNVYGNSWGYAAIEAGMNTRDFGFTYLYHNARRRVGVDNRWDASIKPIQLADYGYNHNQYAFCDERAADYHSMRWMLPHSGVPHPSEGMGGCRRRLLRVNYHGSREQFTFEDWTADVRLSCTSLVCKALTRSDSAIISKSVPRFMKREMPALNPEAIRPKLEINNFIGTLPGGSRGGDQPTPLRTIVAGVGFSGLGAPDVSNLEMISPPAVPVDETRRVTSSAVQAAVAGQVVRQVHTTAVTVQPGTDQAVSLMARTVPTAAAPAARPVAVPHVVNPSPAQPVHLIGAPAQGVNTPSALDGNGQGIAVAAATPAIPIPQLGNGLGALPLGGMVNNGDGAGGAVQNVALPSPTPSAPSAPAATPPSGNGGGTGNGN